MSLSLLASVVPAVGDGRGVQLAGVRFARQHEFACGALERAGGERVDGVRWGVLAVVLAASWALLLRG